MPKLGLTEIVCVIDKSGSMNTIITDAIGGFNTFLNAQQQEPGHANMTIVLFDTNYKVLCDGIEIQKVRPLNQHSYKPGGMTALLDAVGKTIDSVGIRLHNTPEQERPEQVIFAILTDGEENSSQEYTREVVFSKIKHQTDVYNWQFIFLAANQDAIKNAEAIGIDGRFANNFIETSEGINASFASVNEAVSNYRLKGEVNENWKDKSFF